MHWDFNFGAKEGVEALKALKATPPRSAILRPLQALGEIEALEALTNWNLGKLGSNVEIGSTERTESLEHWHSNFEAS
jgi:hypothetical protein